MIHGDSSLAPVCVEEYEQLAHNKLPAEVWDFVAGGSGAELTLAANRQAFDRVRLRPRVLVDVSACPTETTLLGAPVALPVGIAPTAYHGLVHPDGELGTARGAGATNALYVVSMFATRTLEEIAAKASGPLWLQLYWLRRREVLAELIRRAAGAGYRAIVLTVDVPRIGRRLRDLRNGFAIDPSVRAVNLEPAMTEVAHQRRAGESALAAHATEALDPSIT
ncbi:MAG TPA: alpha-hydroxy acid oxidase, partial [Micromonosporaceae bacterium]|nr:alpha-hydroxy acid oxidase [Micromonosporaceae bacterium]